MQQQRTGYVFHRTLVYCAIITCVVIMAFLKLFCSLLLLAYLTDGGGKALYVLVARCTIASSVYPCSAVLEPAGLVALCPGDNLTLTCTIPDGNVIWEVSTDTGSPFLPNDPNIAPVTRGIFSVRVVSVVSTVVTSTATTSDLQPISDGLVIRCRETVNLSQANATLSIAGTLVGHPCTRPCITVIAQVPE